MDARGLRLREGQLSLRNLVVVSLLSCLWGAAPARADFFDYLYVDANAGGASGGHVAVRFGDDVYHFRNAEDSSLRMVREHFDFFRYTYTVFQNRTIHLSRIEVDPETWERLESRFNTRHMIEQEHFDALAWQRSDVRLLERMAQRHARGEPEAPVGLEGEGADAAPALRGARFFGAAGEREEAPTLATLRGRVIARHGDDFLAERLARVDAELARLEYDGSETRPEEPLSKARLPSPRYAFSRRFADLATARLAFEVLGRAAPLRPEMRRVVEGSEGSLDAGERAALAAWGKRLEGDLVELVASRRPDLGYPLLLGMARLLVVADSLRSGQLAVLDAFPSEAATLPAAELGARDLFLKEIGVYARDELAFAKQRVLASGELRERDYNELEGAANRYLEVRGALEFQRPVRVYRERLVPQGELGAPARLLRPGDPDAVTTALDTARRRERESVRTLRDLYGYGLVTNNCVSELFATINGAFEPTEVAERLGARVDPGISLRLIPFVSFGAVVREYRISGVGEIPSYRRARLAEMYAHENPALVYLREANTLSSSVYRQNPEDPLFLFFTDDAVLPRPVFGALNLLAGVGEALVGLVSWPLDGGRAIRSGAKGVLYSLPELAFFNIRKGTLEYGRSTAHRTGLRLTEREGRAPSGHQERDTESRRIGHNGG